MGVWTNHSLQSSTDQLTKEINLLISEIEQEGWDTALKRTAAVEKNWADSARWWPVFLDHQEMDNIEFSMAKVKAYVGNHNQALALGQLEELKLMLRHIPEKEALSIKNIL
jgi:hypothetical protein